MVDVRSSWLVDEALLLIALETSPAGALWTVTATEREPGTGRDVLRLEATDGTVTRTFTFTGPTMVGLGDADLERERQRMVRIVEAAETLRDNIDAHLAFRHQAIAQPAVRRPEVRHQEVGRHPQIHEAQFTCGVAGTVAATLRLQPVPNLPDRFALVLTGFSLTGATEWRLTGAVAERVIASVTAGDADALWRIEPAWVPFYCERCRRCYGVSAWEAHHDSATSVDGVCPQGHRRSMCD